MHEVGVTQQIVAIIQGRMEMRRRESAERESLRAVRVTLEIGKLMALLPDSVRFCFDLCCEGTPLEGAKLEIIETPGTELKIKEVEVESCAEPVAAAQALSRSTA